VRNATVENDSSCRAARCMASNVALRGGALVLTARREASGWAALTTGAVDTHGKRGWGARAGPPARIWVRGTVPVAAPGAPASGAGYWPAFWLMPNDGSCWPDHGELDLMEMINGDGVEHYTYHVSPANASACHGGPVQRSAGHAGPVAPGVPHEYAVELATGRFKFAVDGAVVFDSATAGLPVHDVDWGVILNFAIGGPWAKNATDATAFPAETTVQYVRVARGAA